jgi:hypothetical protein
LPPILRPIRRAFRSPITYPKTGNISINLF